MQSIESKEPLESKEFPLGNPKIMIKQSSVEEQFRMNLNKNQYINPSFEIYNCPTGFHTYGVMGTKLKKNIIDIWRKIFCNSNVDYLFHEDNNELMNDNVNNEFTVYEIDTPIIGPEQMYLVSGHIERFTDRVVKDKNNKIERVDHYLKSLISGSTIIEEQMKTEIINNLDNYSCAELQHLLNMYGEKDRNFGEIYNQNLMMSTKTSYSNLVSYLRPETAQGLITEFKNIYKFHNEKLPFGISQVGRVYRKEINPKPFIRLREFEQAEIELFYDPEEKYELSETFKLMFINIYSASDQSSKISYDQLIVKSRQVNTLNYQNCNNNNINNYILYFMCKIWKFCELLNINPKRLRFRQHLKNELAHYSSDCWDLEYLIRDKSTSYDDVDPDEKNWIEIIGIADRGCFDLTQHSKTSLMTAKRIYNPPCQKIIYDIKFNMKVFGNTFKKNASTYKDIIINLKNTNPILLDQFIENEQKDESTQINYADISFIIDKSMIKITKSEKTISSEEFIPHIVEPSFGIDRLIYAVLNNSFWIRSECKDGTRTVLSLPHSISPYTYVILPLFNKDIILKYVGLVAAKLKQAHHNYKIDCSGASIGRRYSRMDEYGIPFALTIDYQTDKDQTITLRQRDTMQQIRIKIQDL